MLNSLSIQSICCKQGELILLLNIKKIAQQAESNPLRYYS
ncbi:hypothetical protein HMPREF1581_00058 [Gardnerella vaginalis JCP8108]|uniref:Uncharacterized protein n=1 Tax=Gardnerella vaginalis JCP8108 TaxID=1261066 RepID=S4H1D6_GARVA|nr:hypothetical protein HMPREF1581_00058 [Gardnerella vaginalis JCP8108]